MKIFVICASMLLTIKSLLLGIFLLPVMAKAHVMASVVHTTNCLVAHAYQATKEGQILTPLQLYYWANEHVTGIKVMFVSKQNVAEHSLKIEPRLQNAKTVVVTRSHHTQICSIG